MKKVTGGSQYEKYGKTHYERNRQKYIDRVTVRRKKNQVKLVEYKKTISCLDCGIQDFRVIDFDHLPGTKTKKRDCVAYIVNSGVSWDRIMEEIKKCEPRCANCHRIKTWTRKNKRL